MENQMSSKQAGATSPDLALISVLNKDWADASEAERIEKLRAELREFQYLTNRVVELERKVAELQNHSHTDGKVVVPVLPQNQGLMGYSGGLASRRSYIN